MMSESKVSCGTYSSQVFAVVILSCTATVKKTLTEITGFLGLGYKKTHGIADVLTF